MDPAQPRAELTQVAPYPADLYDLVARLHYRPGWRTNLWVMERDKGCRGLTLVVYADVFDAYHPTERRPVNHYFIVPAATYDRLAWRDWLLERLVEVERHEACEHFAIDDEHPYAPNHGPGRNPYTTFVKGTEADAETRFDAERTS